MVALMLVNGMSTNGEVDGTWTGEAPDGVVGAAAPSAARSEEVMEPKRPVPVPKMVCYYKVKGIRKLRLNARFKFRVISRHFFYVCLF